MIAAWLFLLGWWTASSQASAPQTSTPKPAPVEAALVARGKDVFEAKKCSTCHVVGDAAGGDMGPDLSNVGNKRKEAWLKSFLLNPRDVVPGSMMPPVKVPDDDLKALIAYLRTLKTKTGS